jgi:large subunit ribosomal protein L3
MLGLLGKKLGMTRVYDDRGRSVPVTVVQAGPCPVLQVKTADTDGYSAIQIGFESAKKSRWKKPQVGHCVKADTTPQKFVREIRTEDLSDVKAGDTLTVKIFEEVQYVDVSGVTKGKGYQGVMRRWGFGGQPATHGTERKHRSGGSIGGGAAGSTGRTIKKGKRMAGHTGHEKSTVRNSKVLAIDEDKNVIMVKGAIPGPNGGYLVIKPALSCEILVKREKARVAAEEKQQAEKGAGRR